MKNNGLFSALMMCLISLACGGAIDTEDGEDLGTSEAAYSVMASSDHHLFGTGGNYTFWRGCKDNDSPGGQPCYFLRSYTLNTCDKAPPTPDYCTQQYNIEIVESDFSLVQRDRIRDAVDKFCVNLATQVNISGGPTIYTCNRVGSGQGNVVLRAMDNGGSTPNAKWAYVAPTWQGCYELLVSSAPNRYYVCDKSTVYLDVYRLENKMSNEGWLNFQKTKVRRDTWAHGIFLGIGFGSNTDVAAGSQVTAHEMGSPGQTNPFLSGKEKCRLRSLYNDIFATVAFSPQFGTCN